MTLAEQTTASIFIVKPAVEHRRLDGKDDAAQAHEFQFASVKQTQRRGEPLFRTFLYNHRCYVMFGYETAEPAVVSPETQRMKPAAQFERIIDGDVFFFAARFQ